MIRTVSTDYKTDLSILFSSIWFSSFNSHITFCVLTCGLVASLCTCTLRFVTQCQMLWLTGQSFCLHSDTFLALFATDFPNPLLLFVAQVNSIALEMFPVGFNKFCLKQVWWLISVLCIYSFHDFVVAFRYASTGHAWFCV